MGDFIREVEEELRQERLEKLWKRYGVYLIAAAVLVVVGFAAWKIWQSNQRSAYKAEGLQYYHAETLLREGKTKEAAKAFAAISASSSAGYGILSRFDEASMHVKAGDAKGAISIYEGLASDSNAPPSMRHMATILSSLQALKDKSIDEAAIEKKLQPLAQAGSAYRPEALEIMAAAALRAGNNAKAIAHYKTIVDDADAPPGIRSRASQMLKILGAS